MGMKKLSRDQRRKKRKALKAEQGKKKRERAKKNKPWKAVKMKMFRLPQLFPPDFPREKRFEIAQAISKKAKEDFKVKYAEANKWFEEFDALYLLSFCALYFSSHVEGTDPEATGEMDFPPHLLEIMQALALTKERAISTKPLLSKAKELQESMRELSELAVIRLAGMPEEMKSEEELHAIQLQGEMRGNTFAIRNWAYFHQMKRVTLELASLIDSDFKKKYGIGAQEFMRILFEMIWSRNDKLHEHREKVWTFYGQKDYKEMIRAYSATFPDTKPVEGEDAEKLWQYANKSIKQLQALLVCHADLKLEDIYKIDSTYASQLLGDKSEKEVLVALLDQLSFSFGELKDFDKERILLTNPVTRKPFIKLDDSSYYSAIWGALPHYALEILESLVWPHDGLKIKYSEERSHYLERETERLFKEAFPNGHVYSGSLWQQPGDSVQYENDLLLVIDSFAVVVEAKSGLVTDPAKRGAPDRLKETLQHLIEEPSEQALRFMNFLSRNPGEHVFKTKRGTENRIDTSKVKYFIPLGITFSHLGMISSNLKKLIEAGIVDKKLEDLAPSMTVTDLEVLFQILESEAERIHYFARRREIEAHLDYEGDEMDLLAFYLDNGFNIGETEYAQDMVFNIGMKSKELDPYVIGTSEGRAIKKPRLQMTEWWRDMLTQIQNKRTEGWLETCFVLLNSTKEDQRKFQSGIRVTTEAILGGRAPKPHNWVIFVSGPERRRYVISGYPYTTEDKELRNGIMAQALDDAESHNPRGSVVIGINLNKEEYPYSVLARRLATDLFDTLTLPPREPS
jgi:hypothetical protein